MNYEQKAKDIDRFLIENNVKAVKKCDIKALFKISHSDQSAVWSAMQKLGYTIHYSHVEKQ